MRRAIFLLLVVLLLRPAALAAEAETATGTDADAVIAQTAEAIGTQALADGLPDSAAKFLEGISPTDAGDLGDGIASILTQAAEESSGSIRSALAVMGVILAVLVLCAVLGDLDLGSTDTSNLVGTLAITAACTGSLSTMVGLGQETLQDITAFTTLLLPTLAAATAATGATASSSVIYVASVFFADILMTVVSKLLMPLVCCFVALSAADAALGNAMLGRLRDCLRSVTASSLKAVLLLFTAYLSVSGIISGSADAATIRATKLALSTAVPVVGSILSDASETVLVSASLLRTSLGVFGMLAVLAICILPFLQIGVQYLALKGAAAVGSVTGNGQLIGLVDAMATAMGMILAMTGSCALMLLISCVCSMKAVTV